MSSSEPGPSTASVSSILQIQALNSTGHKRPYAQESEHSTDRKRKKHKRGTNLEPSSSAIAATGVSQSLTPPSSIAATVSPRKDKEKKRKRRKKKTSVVTSEIEEDRAKHKRANSLVKAAPVSTMTPFTAGSSGRMEPNNRGADVVADANNPDKGKGKEKAQERALSHSPSSQGPNSSMAHGHAAPGQQLIDDLKKQLEAQSQLLQRHQTHLASIQQSLTCQICLDLLYKPFALAPCGHVACYDCLVRWFTAPGPGENHTDNDNVNQGRATANGARGHHIHKRKTCPICRARVSERPVEVWGMKDMVNALIRSKLVETPNTSGRDVASPSNDDHNGQADPWQRIFRAVRTAYGGHHPFIPWWGGDDPVFPPERVDGPVEDVGMFDAEDHVYRCLDCMHEIWDGHCSQCDREYPGHPDAGDDDEDEDEDGDVIEHGGNYSDEELHGLSIGEMLERIEGDGAIWPFRMDGDSEDEEEIFSDEDGEAAWELGAIYRGGGPLILEDDEDDDDDDGPVFAHISEEEEAHGSDGYESSFIDDGGEDSDGL